MQPLWQVHDIKYTTELIAGLFFFSYAWTQPCQVSSEFLRLAGYIFSDNFYFYYEDLQKSCSESMVGCSFVTSILPLEM